MEKLCETLYVSGCMFPAKGAIMLRLGLSMQGFLYSRIRRTDYGRPWSALCSRLDFARRGAFSQYGILLPLVKRIRKELPDKDIWSWTGYTWEEMMLETPDKLELLSLIDILVDGRYDKSKRNLMLQFRGSSNQLNYRCVKIPQKWASSDFGTSSMIGKESYEQVKRE